MPETIFAESPECLIFSRRWPLGTVPAPCSWRTSNRRRTTRRGTETFLGHLALALPFRDQPEAADTLVAGSQGRVGKSLWIVLFLD